MLRACLAATAILACAEAAGPDPNAPLATYGACDLQPSYTLDSQFGGRFRVFPVTVYIDVSGADFSFQARYRNALERGFRSWATASGGELGSVLFVDDPEAAEVSTVFLSQVPGAPLALAASHATDVDRGNRRIVRHALIEFSTVNLRSFEIRAATGNLPHGSFETFVSGLAAHELGHAFGIQTHPPGGTTFLMSDQGFNAHIGPAEADLNTLRDNYCQP